MSRWQILRRWHSPPLISLFETLQRSDLNLLSSSLAFFSILAIVPFLTVSLFAAHLLTGLGNVIEKWIFTLINHYTPGINASIVGELQKIASQTSFEAIGFVGYILLVATSIRLIDLIDESIQKIWQCEKRKMTIPKFILRLFFVLFGPPGIALLIGSISAIAPSTLKSFPLEFGAFVLTFVLLLLLYNVIPNSKIGWLSSSISALLAAIALSQSPFLYIWVNSRFLNYNTIYGSYIPLVAAPYLWNFFSHDSRRLRFYS